MRWPVSLSTQVFGGSSARVRGASAVSSARDNTVERRTEDMVELTSSAAAEVGCTSLRGPVRRRRGGLAGCERFIHCDGCEWEIVSYSEYKWRRANRGGRTTLWIWAIQPHRLICRSQGLPPGLHRVCESDGTRHGG